MDQLYSQVDKTKTIADETTTSYEISEPLDQLYAQVDMTKMRAGKKVTQPLSQPETPVGPAVCSSGQEEAEE